MSAVDIIDGRGYILNVEFGGGKDGVDGKDGRDGVAPDLQIGTVKESEDDQPHVTISDEGDGKLSLNFDLVSGKDGQNGEDGGVFIPSVSQEGVISWIAPEGKNPPQSVSVKGETGATFTPTVSIGGEISWTNDKGLENPNEQNIRGPKGEKGDPFTITKVYNSKAEMDADYSNPDVPMGAFVCITNSVDQSENATLYVKGTQRYTFITDLSGATGMQGVPGIGIGRVGLMEEQHSPLYKEYGVWSDQTPEVLLGTFNLPVGEDGQQGTDGVGIRSVVQTATSTDDNGRNEITVTLTNDATSKFYVENGSKGPTGAQGPAGQNGQDGKDGVGIKDITVEQSTFDGQANVVTVHLSDDTTKTFNIYNGHTGATGTAGTLNTNNASAVIPTSESMSGNISLHKISKTGNYNDLLNKPTIPAAANDSLITIQRNGTTINRFTLNQSSPGTVNILVPTTVAELTDASSYAKKSDLATVATSGSYSDLSNKPIIGNAELTIQSVDNATPETYTEIGKFHANASSPETITLSKVARTGEYNDLLNKPDKSVYSDTNDLVNINNWPSIYTIKMGRKLMYEADGDGVAPTAVLQYGSPITTGKQKWNGNSGDYIKYVPLDSNKEYVLEVTITSFSLKPTGVASDECDISGVFFVKARTGDDGYLSACPALMSYKLYNGRVYSNGDIHAKLNGGYTVPLITYYLRKKVGTITYGGGNTADVFIADGSTTLMTVGPGVYAYKPHVWANIKINGVTSKYTCPITDPNGTDLTAAFIGDDNKLYIDENSTAEFNINGLKIPVTFTDRGPVGEYSISLTEAKDAIIANKTYIANIADDHSYVCMCDYNYGTNAGNFDIEACETSTAIDDLETSFDESINKIWILSAPEVSGGSQRRLVIAITNSQNQGGGFNISAAIRVLKTTSANETYNYSDYDHISLL